MVIEKALERASQMNDASNQLLLSTMGAVFLGCPLRGTRHAKATSWLNMVTGILGYKPSDTLIRDLEGKNGVLEALHRRFSSLAKQPWLRLELHFFHETQKTELPHWLSIILGASAVIVSPFTTDCPPNVSNALKLVDDISAGIDGYPNLPLNVPHCMLNKFASPVDGNFGQVAGCIKGLVRNWQKIKDSRRDGTCTRLLTLHLCLHQLCAPLHQLLTLLALRDRRYAYICAL